MITVSAAQTFTAGRLAVALAYGVGTAVVLYALMIGGGAHATAADRARGSSSPPGR